MKTEFATFGGGCFWGVEKYLQETPGVIDAVSGYAGGNSLNPTYSDVCAGGTGHAEVVNVEYAPDNISFAELLKHFIKTYRDTDPNNLKSQSQYRSVVFYRNDEQKKIIEDVFQAYKKENGKKITIQIIALEKFYEAEEFHQDYYGKCRVEP